MRFDLYRNNHVGGLWLAGTQLHDVALREFLPDWADGEEMREQEGAWADENWVVVPAGTDPITLPAFAQDPPHLVACPDLDAVLSRVPVGEPVNLDALAEAILAPEAALECTRRRNGVRPIVPSRK